MLKMKKTGKPARRVISVVSVAALFLASTTMFVSADSTTVTVSNPFLYYLNSTYNTSSAEYNPFYNWDTDNNTLQVPDNDTYKVAASGGQAPLAAMLMSGKTGSEGVSRIVAVSQAAQDLSIRQETLLSTAFSSIASAAEAWSGTGHGKLVSSSTTNPTGDTGLSRLISSGAKVTLDKPDQSAEGEWMYTGEMDALGDHDITDVPQGYMADETAYKEAVKVTADALYPEDSSYVNSKVSAFDNAFDSYVTTAKNLVTASGSGSKRVLYVHNVKTSAGTVQTAYSLGKYTSNAEDGLADYNGYLITTYITKDFGDTNVGDSVLGQTGVTPGADGKEVLTTAALNNIFSNAYSTTTEPQAIVFCNQGDETNFRNLLSTSNQSIFDTLKSEGYVSAAPVGMYDAALRSPDTALAPMWLAYVIHYGAGVQSPTTSPYYTAMENQAISFYSALYNYTASSSAISNMYRPVYNAAVTIS